VERVVLNALATKTRLRDARNLAPSAVGLHIVFGEADPPLANAKMQRIVFAITTFFLLCENH
jgi:hypothetical protein